jgi:steroid delta-isomerase-like uncharacterized protein
MQFWMIKMEENKMSLGLNEVADQSVKLVEKYYGAFNSRQWEIFFSLLTEDVIHDLNQGPRQIGVPAFREFINEMNRCYSEQVVKLVVMSNADGTRVAAEFVIEGTYLQSQAGLPEAQGQKYRLPVGAFFDIKKEEKSSSLKVARITNYYNLNDWIRQVEG